MKKGLAIVTALLCLGLASAASGAIWNFNFQISGTIMNSPAQYSGIFTSGGDGTLQYTLNDAAWPPPSDPAARFAYIWATYFASNYNNSTPGAEKWVGQIPGTFSMVVTNAPTGYTGTVQGRINAKYTIRDMDADGVLDEEEKVNWNNMLDGRLAKLCTDPSTGEMACKAGTGALNHNGFGFVYPPDVNVVTGAGNLNLYLPCPSANEPSSWGTVKSLYR
ncbi:MAG: hypothetical protein V1694_03455 [Candidatus Eisenbacteria bacterium]